MRKPHAPIAENATSQISVEALQQLRTSCSVRALTTEDLRRSAISQGLEAEPEEDFEGEYDATVQLDVAMLSQGLEALDPALARSLEVSVRQDAMVAAEGPISSSNTVPVDSRELESYARGIANIEAARAQASEPEDVFAQISGGGLAPGATTEVNAEDLLEVLPLDTAPPQPSNTDAFQSLIQDAIDRVTMDEELTPSQQGVLGAQGTPETLHEAELAAQAQRVKTVPEAFLSPHYQNHLPPEAAPASALLLEDDLLEVESIASEDIAQGLEAPEDLFVEAEAPMAGSAQPTVAEAPVAAAAPPVSRKNNTRKILVILGLLAMAMLVVLISAVAAWLYFFRG